jgi:hypothetical protein
MAFDIFSVAYQWSNLLRRRPAGEANSLRARDIPVQMPAHKIFHVHLLTIE